MLLSQFIQKPIFLNKTPRGVCRSIGISLKSKRIKYLFCSTENQADFVLPIDALSSFSENALFLSRIRPILPKSYVKLYLGLPIYSFDGKFLGSLLNVEWQHNIAARIFTDNNHCYAFTSIAVIADAIILKKPQTYPLGQPLFDGEEPAVTKSVLKKAIQAQNLIQLTLSLPPFRHSNL